MKRLPLLLALLLLPLGQRPAWSAPSEKDLCKENFDGYRKHLTQNPDDADTWDELRVCASVLFRWNDAAQIASAAIQNKSQRPEPHIILGLAHSHSKEYDLAAAEYKEAIRLKPDMAMAYSQLGLAEIYLKQPVDAATAGAKAVELEPSNPAYHHQLAFSYFLLSNDALCEAEAKKAIALDPNDVAAYKVLRSLYTRQGKTAEADQMGEEAIHANGRLAAAHPFVADQMMGAAPAVAAPAVAHTETPTATPPAEPAHGDVTSQLSAQWESMKIAAQNGDKAKALTYFSDYADTRQVYQSSFERMGPTHMHQTFSRLGELADCDVVFQTATCKCPVDGGNGTFLETLVHFERNEDKVWRIKSF